MRSKCSSHWTHRCGFSIILLIIIDVRLYFRFHSDALQITPGFNILIEWMATHSFVQLGCEKLVLCCSNGGSFLFHHVRLEAVSLTYMAVGDNTWGQERHKPTFAPISDFSATHSAQKNVKPSSATSYLNHSHSSTFLNFSLVICCSWISLDTVVLDFYDLYPLFMTSQE